MARTILIVDDSAINRLMLINTLRDEYDILEAENGKDALDVMRRNRENLCVVLLDIIMPGIDGYEVLRRAKDDVELSSIPVIMVTGFEDEESRTKALSCGANDFILKPYNPEIVKHCVKNNIALYETLLTLKAMEKDKLTGLYCREAFFDKVAGMIAGREAGYYMLSCFDIDNFKLINDQYGAAEGDRILREIGKTVSEDMAELGGVGARISGDNFAVLMPAERKDVSILRFLQKKRLAFSGKQAVVFSIGRYIVADLSLSGSAIYDRAYIAKQSVKGRYDEHIAYFNDTMLKKLIRNQSIILEMDAAIAQRQFEVWYQPQRNHITGALVGAEALVRWRHPEKGLIPPGDFIPLFEQNGFIYELDKYVWEEACRRLRKWLDGRENPVPVSVNVSRQDIFRPGFVETLASLIEKYGLPAELLRLEITESAFAKSTKQIVDVVKRLIAIGFVIEIDDFGSGYSSLNTLKSVPAQVVKLDMRFLEDDNDAERGGNILSSIVRMTKWLGMSVIAEGVEGKEQADYLASIGCSYIQGYLYSKPLPLREFEEYCFGALKEKRLLSINTVENLDNNSFWNPKSMETLIFSSYVGGACIFEYCEGEIELLRANQRFAAILGDGTMSIEDTLRLDWISCLAPESRELVRGVLKRSRETKEEYTNEYVFLNIPGAPGKTYLRGTLRVIAASGERLLVYCTSENITAQREAEEGIKQAELREKRSAEQIASIMRGVGSGITATIASEDGGTKLLFSNDKYYELFGYTREQYDAEVTDAFALVHPDDREYSIQMTANAYSAEQPAQIEYRILRRDGSVRWVRVNLSSTRFSGIPRNVHLCVYSDMTAEREAERKLVETDEQLRFLNSLSHELLTQTDAELGINAALDRLMRYFGGSRACVFEIDAEAKLAVNTYEAVREEESATRANPRAIPISLLQNWIAEFDTAGYCVIADVSALDIGRKEERELLTARGIRSLFAVPLWRGTKLIGMMGVDDPRRPLSHIERLIAIGDYIAVMLTRRDLNRRIQDDVKYLSALMDDMPGGFVQMRLSADETLEPFYYNEGFANLVGMNRDEIRALYTPDVLNGVHPDDHHVIKAAVKRMLETGRANSSRYRIRHQTDSYIWVTTFGRITKGLSGETVLNAYFLDATDQVREEEMQKSLMDNLPCGAGIYEFKDGQMSLTYQNKIYWELVGLNEEAYPDPNEMSAIHPDDIPVVMRELSSAIEQRRDVACDIRLRHLTRGYRPVHLMGRIVYKEAGGFLIYATFAPADSENVTYQQVLNLLLSAMMDSTTDMFFAKDTNLRYICASRAFVEMAGLKDVGGIVGKTDEDIFPAENASVYRADDIKLLNGGEPLVDRIEAIPSRRGSPRWASTSKYALRDGEGRQIGIFGISRDKTEERATASRLEALTNSLPGGIAAYIAAPDALDSVRMTYFSDGLCRLHGYSREEYARLMRESAFALVHPEDLAELKERVSDLISLGKPIDSVYRTRALNGSYKWVNAKVVPGEPEGDTQTANAVFFDVTERQEALEKLRMSEEVNRLAIRQSRGIVCRYDVASRRLTVPDDVSVIFKSERIEEDIPYKPVRDGRVSPDTVDAYIAFYESILRGEKKGVARYQRESTQGWRWIEAHFTTIFSSGGEPATAVISIFDVTESIEKDAAYRKWKRSIQDKKPESYSLYRCSITKSVVLETSEGLLISDKRLENSANLERHTANYADICVLNEDQQRYLSFMNRDAMLLRYSQGRRSDALEYREKLPDGGYRWLRLSVDFMDSPYSSEVEAFLLFEDIDEAKRAELALLDRAEKDQLTGALNRGNFIAKAERKLGKGRPGTLAALFIIDLDGFKQVNDFFGHVVGDETLIEISQKLRDTFRDGDLVCRLGGDEFMVYMDNVTYLSTVKERAALICALLHKSFSLEVQLSASVGISIHPDNGEDFETLYRKADAALYHVKRTGKDGYAFYEENMAEREFSSETAAIEKAAAAETVYAKPKLRMLIVDDNEINRDYLTGLFEDEYLIDTAAEGTAALVRLNRYGSGISVVLLDLMMPGTDGFAVLRKMRESVTMQNIPVIVVSGMNERENALEAIRSGASDYITKPVDADLLKLRVASAIGKAENEQLRARNRYLAMRNEETRRLAEARAHSEELSVALHAAEKADLAKSQFLSSMSHEIRTPLNAVIGYNTIARDQMSAAKTDEERKQVSMKVLSYLTKSEVASRHLLTIINDVLDMSAIESGKLKVEDSPFDFRGLITSLTVMFFSQARAKGVDFEVLFDKPTEEWFVGDQLRINQVLTNLLSNAVKFTPEGGSVTLAITETRVDERSTRFRFAVSDTGIGMTQEYLGHIWTPFEQAEASISRRFGGSGLGLSITKNLVDLMGGSIAVESKSGVGSKFSVELTLTRTEQPKKAASIDFSGVNALVVDDDANTCEYIKLLFDRCGAECSTFTSGRQALSAFDAAKRRGKPFNVCLVDWRMPQMDGFTTISEIRRIAAKDLPIVVVTAYDFDEIAEHTENLGINRFISKPLFQSSLFDLFATICGQRGAKASEETPKYDFDGARVLLVEDNNMNMEVAKHVLLSAKLAVDCAWNGQEAFDIFSASKPGTYQAILMDVHMPVIDGYQATRMIRREERADARSIPIIAMTADVFAEDIERAHDSGMNDHIAKPIDIETLYKMLSLYLEGGSK